MIGKFLVASKRLLKNVVIIVFITIVLLEIIGLFIRPNSYFWDSRQTFISNNSLRKIDNSGLWTYKPNSQVTSAATYFLSLNNGWLEYLCKFKTNQFGLIDTNYSNQKEIDFLVLGDSFLEGQGGCPWLTRDRLEKERFPIVINGGLQGTGIQNFELLTKWLENSVKIKNLVIFVISNDFKRGLDSSWLDHTRCLNQNKCGEYDRSWWGFDQSSSKEDILKIAALRHEQRLKWDVNIDPVDNYLRYYSMSYRVIFRYFDLFKLKNQNSSDQSIYQSNFESLQRLKKLYPNLKIILVPQKDEVGFFGKKNQDTKIVEEFLDKEDFKYSRCELKISDYMKIDGHPNKKGYGKLFKCLKSVVN